MSEPPADVLDFEPSSLKIGRELKSSEASSIFEVELLGNRFAMKVVSCPQDFNEVNANTTVPRPRGPRFYKEGT